MDNQEQVTNQPASTDEMPIPVQQEKQSMGFVDKLVVAYIDLTGYKGDQFDSFLTPSQVPCTAVLEELWFFAPCPQCEKRHVMPSYLVYIETVNMWVIKPVFRILAAIFAILKPILGPLFARGRDLTAEATKEVLEKKKEMERQAAGVPQSAEEIQREKEKMRSEQEN